MAIRPWRYSDTILDGVRLWAQYAQIGSQPLGDYIHRLQHLEGEWIHVSVTALPGGCLYLYTLPTGAGAPCKAVIDRLAALRLCGHRALCVQNLDAALAEIRGHVMRSRWRLTVRGQAN